MTAKLRCILIVAVWLFSVEVFAAPTVPNLSGRVVDSADLIDAKNELEISQKLQSLEQSSSNQLVVLTVPDLQGYDVAEFAIEVARHWQLGQKEKDNGVLLLVARDERKIRIEVGYGLEGDLPDAIARRIIQNQITPEFKRGNFALGIDSGVDAIIASLEGSYTASKPESKTNFLSAESPLIPMGFVTLFGLFGFLQGNVKKRTINALVGATFGGTLVGLATQHWALGLLGALFFGFLLSRSKMSAGGDGIVRGYDGYRGTHSSGGSFGGGGFSGGGGGFGGGGASGGW